MPRRPMLLLACAAIPAALMVTGVHNARQMRANRLLVQGVRAADPWIVRDALDAGANPNAEDVPEQSVPPGSSLRARWAALKALLGLHGPQPPGTPVIVRAAQSNSQNSIWALIERGADLRRRDAEGHDALLCALSQNSNADVETVRTLLRAGADANEHDAHGCTPLGLAAYNASHEKLAAVLPFVTDVDVRDRRGATPLYWAAYWGNPEVFDALLARGAAFDVRDYETGETPLIVAAQEGHTDIVKRLLSLGADVNAKARGGYTGLILASAWGKTETVKLLLARGADPSVRDAKGRTALSCAGRSAQSTKLGAEVRRVLAAAGVRR